jgi:hypothetical protein
MNLEHSDFFKRANVESTICGLGSAEVLRTAMSLSVDECNGDISTSDGFSVPTTNEVKALEIWGLYHELVLRKPI